jgi:hypothetical protein
MKKILMTLFVLIILIAGCAGCGEALNHTTYIEGSRVGYIVKFAERGLFSKTYQGEVNMGGILSAALGGGAPNTWNFSLDNQRRRGENLDSIAVMINVFLSTGQPVKISYYAPFFSWPWRSNNRYLVQKVEAIPRK